jgi:hypothetical protein
MASGTPAAPCPLSCEIPQGGVLSRLPPMAPVTQAILAQRSGATHELIEGTPGSTGRMLRNPDGERRRCQPEGT